MPDAQWPESKRMWERAKRSLSGGVSTGLRAAAKPHPIFFTGGAGATLTDVDGNVHIDYVLGWGPNILGHGNPRLVAAVTEQIARGATYGSGHRYEFDAAEALLARYPDFERVLWSNTGTEADLVALRIARAATGRHRFIKFTGHYHGWSDTMLLGYRSFGDDGQVVPESRGQSGDALTAMDLVPWGDLDALRAALDDGDDIAAVVLEPVLCNTGVIAPSEGFLQGVRDLCTEHGAVLIFDEVITGLRIAPGGAVERFGIVPDLVVLAKAIAGGLTLAAILGSADLLDLTQQGVTHAGTYNGNPLVLAAALATMQELSLPGVYDEFERRSARLAQGIRDALRSNGVVGAVNQIGPVIQIGLGVDQIATTDDFFAADTALYDHVAVEMLRRGIFLMPGGRLYLSTAHTDEQIEKTITAFADVFAELPTPAAGRSEA
ncbi:MAG: aspartate aminotransferase family protein [Microbacterium sp.]|nr:MAG: aspartate aminotransferase family protein [Microbacterium sp.]